MTKVMIHEGAAEQPYELFDDTTEVSFGRGTTNDVQLADPHASKQHFVLRRIRGRWRLVDLESKDGTRVNGQVRNAHWLEDGDTIVVGATHVRFEAEGVACGAPPARAPAAAPARPAAALRPAAAVPAPARPAAALPARPAVPAAAPPPVVMRAPAAAPAPAPPAAPAPAPRAGAAGRAAPRRRSEVEVDEEGREVPVRRPQGMSGAVIGLLVGVGALVLFFILQGALSGSNHNSVVREQAQALREKRQYKQALETLERGLRRNEPGEYAILEEIEQLKVMVAQEAISTRESEVYAFFNREIARKLRVANLRPLGHPSDEEAARILRSFFTTYGDSQFARTMLYAKASDNAQYAGYQQIMRENPDPRRTDAQAAQEMDMAVAPLVQQNRLGAAYDRVRLSLALERLSLSPELLKRFEPRVDEQLRSLESQAQAMVDKALLEGRSLAQSGQADLARTKVRTILKLLEWPEGDLSRRAEDQMRGW